MLALALPTQVLRSLLVGSIAIAADELPFTLPMDDSDVP